MKRLFLASVLILISCSLIAQNHINTDKWTVADTFSMPAYDDLSAAASDGQYIYLTEWNSGKIIKTDLTGTFIEEFTISGITQIRDLTYDGQYFYGGRADSMIYKLDLAQKQLIGEIPTPFGVDIRSITYDSTRDAFWTGNWNKDFYLVDRNGSVLDTMLYANHNQPNISGLAMDLTNPGGPYLWFFANKNQQPNFLGSLDQPGNFTGLGRDLTLDFASGIQNPKARGISMFDNGNKKFLLGVIEGNPSQVFIYYMNSLVASKDASIVRVVSPSSACQLNTNETLTLEVANTGNDTLTNIPLTVKLLTPTYYLHQETITDTILPYTSINFDLSKSFYMGAINTYSFEIYSAMADDEYRANDTLYKDIRNIEPDTMPINFTLDSLGKFSGWSIFDANNDGYTWHHVEGEGNQGSGAYAYSWNPDGITPANDWLFSPCIYLEGGKYHALKFSSKVGIEGYEEMIRVYIGQHPDTSSMNKLITDRGKINADSFVVATDSFRLYQDKIYYLGFQIYSDPDAYKFFLDDIIIDESVSVPEFSKNDLHIYPNPSSSMVNLDMATKAHSIRLLNTTGQVILQKTPRQTHTQLDISNLESGLYFIVIDSSEQRIVKKIIKR